MKISCLEAQTWSGAEHNANAILLKMEQYKDSLNTYLKKRVRIASLQQQSSYLNPDSFWALCINSISHILMDMTRKENHRAP